MNLRDGLENEAEPADTYERHSRARPEAGTTPRSEANCPERAPGTSDKLGNPSCFNGGNSSWIHNGIREKGFERPILPYSPIFITQFSVAGVGKSHGRALATTHVKHTETCV